MTAEEKKVFERIPKYIRKHISDFWIEEDGDIDEKTGRWLRRYYVIFDGEERFFNSIRFMIWKLREDM